MKRKLYLSFVLLFTVPTILFSQDEIQKLKPEHIIQIADEHYKLDEYILALPYYEKLDSIYPNNALINFRLGICYYNSHHKVKCLPYFLRAKDLRHNDPDIEFYIARGYHLNHNFDEAVHYYNVFKTSHIDTLILHTADRFITMCQVGKELVEDSLELTIENLGPVINSKYPDYGPVVSADESVMMFTSRRPNTTGEHKDPEDGMYYEDVYISYKDPNGSWTSPQDMGPRVNSKHHDASVGISPDGSKLFIYRSGGKGKHSGDIYMSSLEGTKWTQPTVLKDGINSNNWEPSATISADEKTIFFSSDRPGGYGGIDLYVVKKQDDGHWGIPENLGPTINTPYDEDAPYIHPDNKTLFFSSTGHKTMGGFDIFTTVFNAGSNTWSHPENIGYPINTADDDIYFMWSSDGTKGYFSSWREDSYGEKDIYVIHRPNGSANLIVVKGNILSGEQNIPVAATLTVTDLESKKVLGVYSSNEATGKFAIVLPHGKNYSMTVEAPGYLFYSENFNTPENHPFFSFKKNIQLEPMKIGSKIVLNNVFFELNKSTIQKESQSELDRLYDFLQSNPELKVEIAGHTDNTGNDKYNQRLSEKRAQAVVNFLIKKGIEKDRLTAIGYGETQPIVSNDTREGRILNRRTELRITDKDKNKIKYYKDVEIEYVSYSDPKPTEINKSNTDKPKVQNPPKKNSKLARSYWGEDGPPVNSVLRPKVHFIPNDAKTITDYSRQRIINVVKAMNLYKGMKIKIIAYHDETMQATGQELSQKRAEAVYDFMIKQGIEESRLIIETQDMPKEKLSQSNTEKVDGRVEFVVIGYEEEEEE